MCIEIACWQMQDRILLFLVDNQISLHLLCQRMWQIIQSATPGNGDGRRIDRGDTLARTREDDVFLKHIGLFKCGFPRIKEVNQVRRNHSEELETKMLEIEARSEGARRD